MELRRASYGQGGSIAFYGPDGAAPDWSDESRFVGKSHWCTCLGLSAALHVQSRVQGYHVGAHLCWVQDP